MQDSTQIMRAREMLKEKAKVTTRKIIGNMLDDFDSVIEACGLDYDYKTWSFVFDAWLDEVYRILSRAFHGLRLEQ